MSKTTKAVKVDESTVEEWEQYVEDSLEVDSISHLIRLSVQREINDSSETPTSNETPAQMDEVVGTLDDISQAVTSIEERLTALEDIESTERQYSLQKAVYNYLNEEREAPYHEWAHTSDDLATALGANLPKIEDVLDELSEQFNSVNSVYGGPENRAYWFKR